ncbi:hypothetical protein QQZ08_009293 [Neonectria magnoliae]|uniref:Uncharacterized protein n=1 Tax=Neonectria magnoliae TaxID=2732573 RepID=A0ABR1HNX1_9HYPO
MRNTIVKDKADKERQGFIDLIETDAIFGVLHRHTTQAYLAHGSFNVCVFVEFDTSPPEKWAVQIPLLARTA